MGVCAGRGHLQGRGGMRRLLVFSFLRGGAAEASFAHFHLMAAICDYMSRNASCPRRDDWKSVALPLQSYRSTAAGVSSSAPPPPSFLPESFYLLLLCPIEKLPVAPCWLLWETTSSNNEFAQISHLAVSLTCSLFSVINMKPSPPAGIPILTTAITIPSCSSRPCWPAMSHSLPTRR